MKKCILKAILPQLQHLKTRGVKRTRKRNCGARGYESHVDHWKWPKADEYLFPSKRTGNHMKKDAVCHSIAKARKLFHCDIDGSVRSHSGRHRMINDLKASSIPSDAGMMFARIKDKKTWAGYGQLTPLQCSTVLQKNKDLQKTLQKLYK